MPKHAKEYVIAGPIPINHNAPGSVLKARDVEMLDLLVSIGWLVPVKSGTASSTIPMYPNPSTEEKVLQ